jgi:hypothetical protein
MSHKLIDTQQQGLYHWQKEEKEEKSTEACQG